MTTPDDLDFDGTFDRWWQSEVHPTVKPSLHSRTTHLGFAQAMVQKARELDAQARGEAIEQSQDYFNARAALAADGPAVPEGREPASVVGEPSDEELAQAAKAAIHDYKYPTELVYFLDSDSSEYEPFLLALRAVIAADRARWGHQPAPPVAGAPGPSMEDVSPLIAWLTEQACQAADASQPTDAGMLTWAAQVVGERVNEDAPDPPVEGEVAELVKFLREQVHVCLQVAWTPGIKHFARTADLLEQRHPEPVPVSERLPGLEDCDAEGRCWWFCLECPGEHSYWILAKEVYCEPTYWLPAHALPLPQGEVEP